MFSDRRRSWLLSGLENIIASTLAMEVSVDMLFLIQLSMIKSISLIETQSIDTRCGKVIANSTSSNVVMTHLLSTVAGNNAFICSGVIMLGPDFKTLLFTTVMIIVPSILFFTSILLPFPMFLSAKIATTVSYMLSLKKDYFILF